MVLTLLLACSPSVLHIPGPLATVQSAGARPERAEADREAEARRPHTGKPGSASGETYAAVATDLLGRTRVEVEGERYRSDCSGLIEAVFAAVDAPWRGSTAMLFEAAREEGVLHRRRIPAPGDLAFFDNTYDRDGDGKVNDPLSHVAIVETVDDAGNITMVHYGSNGVTRLRMNLRHPEDREGPAGELWNDYLRAKRESDGPRARYLTGELWVGFGSFWRVAGGA